MNEVGMFFAIAEYFICAAIIGMVLLLILEVTLP